MSNNDANIYPIGVVGKVKNLGESKVSIVREGFEPNTQWSQL